MLPSIILRIWALGLVSFGIVAGGFALVHEWWQRGWGWDPVREQSVFMPPHLGWNGETAILTAAATLMLLALMGRSLLRVVLPLTHPGKTLGDADPFTTPKPACRRAGARPGWYGFRRQVLWQERRHTSYPNSWQGVGFTRVELHAPRSVGKI